MSGTKHWEQNVQALLDEYAGKRVNGKVASHKTVKHTTEVLFNFFHTLHRLGYQVQHPKNVGERHIEAAVRHWHFDKKLAPKSLQDYTSRLRVVFEHWIGKSGMVKAFAKYLPDVPAEELVVKTSAAKSKSWTEAGIDVVPKLMEADKLDERLGMMLRMQLAFGLRRKEAILCRPWIADRGDVLQVYPGEGKGNRPRMIPIETEVQKSLLKAVQNKVGKREALGWPNMIDGTSATLEQKEKRYNRYMARLGLTKLDAGATGHGLRGQYAENKALLQGFVPATLGGTPGQMPKDELTVLKLQVSEALGHSRESITSAYYGTLSRFKADENPNCFRESMAIGLAALAKRGALPSPPAARLQDCFAVIGVAYEHGVEIVPSQAYALWLVHCVRFGTEWLPADGATAAALSVAARAIDSLDERVAEPA